MSMHPADLDCDELVMRVAVDATFVRRGRVGGAEQLARNLVAGLSAAGASVDVLVRRGEWEKGEQPYNLYAVPGQLNRFVAGTLAAAAQRQSYDALIGANYFVPPLVGRQRVVCGVIYDLQYRRYPQFFSWRKRRWLRLAHSMTLHAADAVVAISETVKDELLTTHGARYSEKVVVIPVPVSWDHLDGTGSLTPPFHYVLSVAAQYPHKNLATLVSAFGHLKKRSATKDLKLVIVGQKHTNLVGVIPTRPLEDVIASSPVASDIVAAGYLDDTALQRWYRHATVVALPSLYEGFGMPAVEALGLGLPTVTTRCGAIPETTLGLANYVEDPMDDRELAEVLADVVANRERYIPRSEDVARVRETYAPRRIGEQYLNLLTSFGTH